MRGTEIMWCEPVKKPGPECHCSRRDLRTNSLLNWGQTGVLNVWCGTCGGLLTFWDTSWGKEIAARPKVVGKVL